MYGLLQYQLFIKMNMRIYLYIMCISKHMHIFYSKQARLRDKTSLFGDFRRTFFFLMIFLELY